MVGTARASSSTMMPMTMRISVRVKAEIFDFRFSIFDLGVGLDARCFAPPLNRKWKIENRKFLISLLKRINIVIALGEISIGSGGGEEGTAYARHECVRGAVVHRLAFGRKDDE